jgi:hypothetical protein
MGPQGLQPQAPLDIRNQLQVRVAGERPDFTSNLPGTLIEDVLSTEVAAVVESDSFLCDLVNSVSPNGANAFLLGLFGVLYGLKPQAANNTSVYVVFYGPPGYVIVDGFTVSDGTYRYLVQDGGIIASNGQSTPLYCVADTFGSWAVAAGSVTQLLTSVPAQFNVSCSNPEDGIPSSAAETVAQYRDRVLTAGLAASTGMSRYLKTRLGNVQGVQARLVSAVQTPSTDDEIGFWTVIVGGGDPYQVAYEIWRSMAYLPGLRGARVNIVNISWTNPIVVTTDVVHALVTGETVTMADIKGPATLNYQGMPCTVTGDRTFTLPIDGTAMVAYQGGGYIVSPLNMNETVSISDYPDVYTIPYVIPSQETVSLTVTWDTDAPGYVSQSAMAQAAQPVLIDYINSLPVGTTPLNLNAMNKVFLDAVQDILIPEQIISLDFSVAIDGVNQTPELGTEIIPGDPYSYFATDASQVAVVQG